MRFGELDQAADAIRMLRALGQDDLIGLRDTYADAAQTVAEREVFRLIAQESAPAKLLSAPGVENGGPASFPP